MKRIIERYALLCTVITWAVVLLQYMLFASTNTNSSSPHLRLSPIQGNTNTTSEIIQHTILRADILHEQKVRNLPSKKVFMTAPWAPKEIIAKSLLQNPDLEFHVFNDKEIALSVKHLDSELEAAGVPGVWDAWKALRPWAFRADLWRYLILWSEGGIYMDNENIMVAPAEAWAALSEEEELATCYDMQPAWTTAIGNQVHVPILWQAALSAKKKSPVLLDTIRMVVSTIQNRKYALHQAEEVFSKKYPPGLVLSITGPVLLGYAVAKAVSSTTKSRVRLPCRFRDSYDGADEEMHHFQADLLLEDFVGINETIPFSTDYRRIQTGKTIIELEMKEKETVRKAGSQGYWSLHRDGKIYCDDNATLSEFAIPAACDIESILNRETVVQEK